MSGGEATAAGLIGEGYCLCWFMRVRLHDGHCCFRTVDCALHPVTPVIRALVNP